MNDTLAGVEHAVAGVVGGLLPRNGCNTLINHRYSIQNEHLWLWHI